MPEIQKKEMQEASAPVNTGKRQKPGKTMARLLGIMIKEYGVQLGIVVICIIAAALCTLKGTLFMQTLIDDYILPPDKHRESRFHASAEGAGITGCYICSRNRMRLWL